MPDEEQDKQAILGSAEPLSPAETQQRLDRLAQWGVNLALTRAKLGHAATERVRQSLKYQQFTQKHRLAPVGGAPALPGPASKASVSLLAPDELIQQLAAGSARYVLVGSAAAVALGAPLTIRDLDLCYDPDPTNVAHLAHALMALHPQVRAVPPSDDSVAMGLDEPRLRHLLQTEPLVALQTEAGPVDLVSRVSGVGSYPVVKEMSLTLELFGLPVHVLDLPALIENKRARLRPEDQRVLPELEATLRLRNQQH